MSNKTTDDYDFRQKHDILFDPRQPKSILEIPEFLKMQTKRKIEMDRTIGDGSKAGTERDTPVFQDFYNRLDSLIGRFANSSDQIYSILNSIGIPQNQTPVDPGQPFSEDCFLALIYSKLNELDNLCISISQSAERLSKLA